MPVLGNDIQESVYEKYKEVMKTASAKDVVDFLKKRGEHHDHFYHYTNMDAAEKIRESGELWLSLLTSSDDPDEAREDKYAAYGICLCYDPIENLSMWYLYGGLGLGGRLGYSSIDMARIFNEGKFYLFNNDEQIELLFSDDSTGGIKAEKSLSDILYCKKTESGAITSYFGCDYYDCETRVLDELRNIHGGIFLKNLIWKYEFETRMVVFVPRDMIPDDADKFRVKVVSPSIKNAQLVDGPEIKPIEVKHVISEFSGKVAVYGKIKKNIKRMKEELWR